MTKKTDRPAPPKRPAKKSVTGQANARGDFYFDELMTPQPDATREYYRAQLLKPIKQIKQIKPPATKKP